MKSSRLSVKTLKIISLAVGAVSLVVASKLEDAQLESTKKDLKKELLDEIKKGGK